MLYVRLLVIILLGVGVIFAYIKYLENNSIYYPVKEIYLDPKATGLAFEDIYITTQDGLKINGWFIAQAKAKYTLLFFHGNAGNIGDRLDKIQLLNHLGLNMFIVDYRGYGKSQGKPAEKGFYSDAKASYDYLLNIRKIKPEQIILYGESLGAAVAIDLASKDKVGALIVEGAFSSGKDMAGLMYPFLPGFFFSDIYDSLTKVKKIDIPKLFIHSRNDEMIPFSLAGRLYDAAPGKKEFAEISGGHNTAFLDSKEKYVSSIAAFIEKL